MSFTINKSIMKKKYHEHVKVGWLTLLLTILTSSLPGGVSAEDWVATPGNYSIRQDAEGVLRFELPVYDQEGSDAWVNSAEIYYEGSGVPRHRFIQWYSVETDIATDRKYTNTRVVNDVDGKVTAVR